MSCHLCVGIVAQEPKRYYAKTHGKDEISDFWLYIKKPEKSNNFDLLKFEAFKGIAKFVNENIHQGDTVEVRSRPETRRIVDKKTGKKRTTIIFRVAFIRLICHRNRLLLNEFGGDSVPQLEESEFIYWG